MSHGPQVHGPVMGMLVIALAVFALTRRLVPLRKASATPGSSIVSVNGLTKRYGERVAVDDLTFSLQPGTVTGFPGPDGAGETTTLRLLGLAEPTAGEALVLGRRYAELDQPARRVWAPAGSRSCSTAATTRSFWSAAPQQLACGR